MKCYLAYGQDAKMLVNVFFQQAVSTGSSKFHVLFPTYILHTVHVNMYSHVASDHKALVSFAIFNSSHQLHTN